jgi:hypothetical protein
MLLAQHYHEYSNLFKTHHLNLNSPSLKDAFEEGNNILIEKFEGLDDSILPIDFEFIGLHCWILGEKLTQTIFGAEKGLEKLFVVKAKTLGLNTDLFNGLNCHIWLAPLEISESYKNCAVLVKDKRLLLPTSKLMIPILDINQAIYTHEDVTRV